MNTDCSWQIGNSHPPISPRYIAVRHLPIFGSMTTFWFLGGTGRPVTRAGQYPTGVHVDWHAGLVLHWELEKYMCKGKYRQTGRRHKIVSRKPGFMAKDHSKSKQATIYKPLNTMHEYVWTFIHYFEKGVNTIQSL